MSVDYVDYQLDQLDALESEGIHIIREVAAEFERPVLLFSGGKDSVVMLHLAAKAFWPGPVPFALLHIDTGHNFPEVLAYRDAAVARLGARLHVASVQDYIDDGRLRDRADGTRNPLQTLPLLDAIAGHRFDAVFGGGRRDEEKARAKERVFSLRDEFGQWDPRNQRPELWNLYNGKHRPGEHVRVFPLSNWTELDVWRYIARERIDLPSLYYAHDREVFERDGEQCTYVDSAARRCESKTLLELDHVTPRAHGGADDAANLRVRCRAHNRMYAEDVFGKAYVAKRIHCRQHQSRCVMNEAVVTQSAAVPPELVEQATRGLVNMGFAKSEVSRAVHATSVAITTACRCPSSYARRLAR